MAARLLSPDGSIDRMALEAEIEALALEHESHHQSLRLAVVQLLKAALSEGRAFARARFYQTRRGLECARFLSQLQDEILHLVYAYVTRFEVSQIPSRPASFAVLAVGGYGRGTLAPGSDIDLLFLRPEKDADWANRVAEAMLYVLWDLGQKIGHAVRSVEENLSLARRDMTIRTALLEARPVLGDPNLAADLLRRFQDELMPTTAQEFVAAKLAERDERLIKAGNSRYRVEPNVKEGKGGLRDLNTLFWIAKYIYRVRSPAELVKAGLFTRREARLFERAENFLWATRVALHFHTQRNDDRLTFDFQPDIAALLGYAGRGAMRGVERFMKHYFLIAKDVGDLTAILCAALEETQIKPRAMLNRFTSPEQKATREALSGTSDFIIDAGRINVAHDAVFIQDPTHLLRFFWLVDRHGLAPHPNAMRLVTHSLKLIDGKLRENPEANRLFLELLTSRNAPETVLRRMNESGVLGRFIPEFGRVVAMMQFNMYHHFTVDEHLLRTVGELAEIDQGKGGEEHPVVNEIMPSVQNRTALYVAAFLHDIAKGRPEDHSIAGARIARKLCPRLGLSAAETDTVAWLIEHHLLMSTTAQSRDLSERKTIETFAASVQSLERLRLLLILTVADIRAVGPGVWNGWKGQLLRTLFWETELVLAGGHSSADRQRQVEMVQAELCAALSDWPRQEVDRYLARHPSSYWLRIDPVRKVKHARFLRGAAAKGQTVAVEFETDAFRAVTEFTVLAPDHPRLLSTIAGACAMSGANIVDAQITTTTDGMALDTISIHRKFENAEDEMRRAARIAERMTHALEGKLSLSDAIGNRRSRTARKTFDVAPEAIIDNDWSALYTVIEVSGLDRPGLLYDLTEALSSLHLNIASAHIATYGEKATDVFYVTDLEGQKIIAADRQKTIRAKLLTVLSPPSAV